MISIHGPFDVPRPVENLRPIAFSPGKNCFAIVSLTIATSGLAGVS